MKKANVHELKETEQKSPGGKYHVFRKNLSTAIGGKRDAGTWGGGHPFDVELYRMPPEARNFPHHSHAAQWEMYVFLEGRGKVRGPEERCDVVAGDFLIFKPGEAHSILNDGDADLVFYVLADNPVADVMHYPDTGKWGVKPDTKFFRMEETPYYEPGE